MKVKVLPLEDNTNGWSAILPPRAPTNSLNGSVTADWLVIGAGYAGLAAARRLAELNPNESIALLDAGYVGENASGRNSGFAIDVPHNVGSSLAELKKAEQYRRLMKAGIHHLETIVTREGIHCDWSRRGKYHCAVSEDVASSTLSRHVKELETLDEPYELLDKEALSARIGTEYFHSGIYTPGCILLNPAALTRGLASTLPDNVRLHEGSAVTDFDFGAEVRARTNRGEVRARQVLLTNNGHIRHFGFFKREIFPLVSFGSLTKPLNEAQQRRLGGEVNWGVTPANALTGATMRYTQDHRILIRQDFCYTPEFRVKESQRQAALRSHREVFRLRFPMLEDVEIEHFWMGTINITRNGAPGWGRLASNVYAAAGCNGVGIAKQTIAGRLLAELATGEDDPLINDMFALDRPSRLPARPFLDFGIRGYLAKERWVGRGEY
jgi:glycine/D-amino acid oxidase-like deaminating enzyme